MPGLGSSLFVIACFGTTDACRFASNSSSDRLSSKIYHRFLYSSTTLVLEVDTEFADILYIADDHFPPNLRGTSACII